MMFYKFAALIIANELMFGEGNEEYKRVHRYWVRPWIGRLDNSDTAFTLMQELQAVSDNLYEFLSRKLASPAPLADIGPLVGEKMLRRQLAVGRRY